MISASENFSFPWPILGVVLDGTSILDIPKLELRSMEEATNFIQVYGFNVSNAEDLELLWGFFGEAVSFIETVLCDPEFPRIPNHLRERASLNDIRRLLLLASSDDFTEDRRTACAILRIMHVLIHWAHDPRLKYFGQVQNQILSRLDSYLHVNTADGATYLGTEAEGGGIKLLFFKKKDRKDKHREIVKLLHKADSMVEEIYDRIGFRLVTETKYDAMRAVRLLLSKNIISLPNIRPGRSRNQLVNLERLKGEVDRIQELSSKEKLSVTDWERLARRMERRISYRRLGKEPKNRHSSEYYRAIQFTCRELVKVGNPALHSYQVLKNQLEGVHGGLQALQEAFPMPPLMSEYVFFPYEIQIMDVKAYADSIFGRSNHEEYRKKQLESARNRVFGRSSQ